MADVDALIALGSAALLARWTVARRARRADRDAGPPRRARAGRRDAGARACTTRSTARPAEDRWLLTRAVPVHDEAGAIDFVVWVGEDVTAVKRQEVRERLLSNASKLLSSSLEVDATIDKAAWAVVPELADWARIDLRDERGALVQMAVAHRDLETRRAARRVAPRLPARRGRRPRAGGGLAHREVDRLGRCRRRGCRALRPVAAPCGADADRSTRARSLIVPMVVGDRVIGTMQLATTSESGRKLGAADLEVAEELARRAAIAVDHARVHAIAHAHRHDAATVAAAPAPAGDPGPGDRGALPRCAGRRPRSAATSTTSSRRASAGW